MNREDYKNFIETVSAPVAAISAWDPVHWVHRPEDLVEEVLGASVASPSAVVSRRQNLGEERAFPSADHQTACQAHRQDRAGLALLEVAEEDHAGVQ